MQKLTLKERQAEEQLIKNKLRAGGCFFHYARSTQNFVIIGHIKGGLSPDALLNTLNTLNSIWHKKTELDIPKI